MSVDQWSLVVPTLNEALYLESTLLPLQPLRENGLEIIVVDGGSEDDTARMAAQLADQVSYQTGGRGAQLQHGAGLTAKEWLLFLHADTHLCVDALEQVIAKIQHNPRLKWGRFDVRLSGDRPIFRIIERLINLRSSVTSICTGDQGIFVKRRVFEQVGGFPAWPLLEDIELSRRLKKVGVALRLRAPIETSSRRWEANGVFKTIAIMWLIRLGFSMGISPFQLNRWYRPHVSR